MQIDPVGLSQGADLLLSWVIMHQMEVMPSNYHVKYHCNYGARFFTPSLINILNRSRVTG